MFLISTLICTVPSIQIESLSRPRVIFPAHEDFVWQQGDIHNIRWHGISRGSFVKIMLVWQNRKKAMEYVLVHHIASFGSLPFRMPYDSPVGKSFRIQIISKLSIDESADSCSFAIQTKLKDNYWRSVQPRLKRYDVKEFFAAPCLAVATAARVYSAHIKEDYAHLHICAHSLPSKDRLFEKRQYSGGIDHMKQLSPETVNRVHTLQTHGQDETLPIFELAARSAFMKRARQIQIEENKRFEAELGCSGQDSHDYNLQTQPKTTKLPMI